MITPPTEPMTCTRCTWEGEIQETIQQPKESVWDYKAPLCPLCLADTEFLFAYDGTTHPKKIVQLINLKHDWQKRMGKVPESTADHIRERELHLVNPTAVYPTIIVWDDPTSIYNPAGYRGPGYCVDVKLVADATQRLRINFSQMRMQIINDEGDILTETPFAIRDLFALARHGIPVHKETDE